MPTDTKPIAQCHEHLTGLLQLVNIAFKCPYSMIAFFDENQSWSKKYFGENGSDFQPSDAFYSKVISSESFFINENAIGIKIKNKELKAIGVFCIIDQERSKFSVTEQNLMMIFLNQFEIFFEKKRLEQFFYDQNENYVQNSRLTALGQMSAEIIHEINTPIAIIRVHIEMLARQIKSSQLSCDEILTSLDKVLCTTARMSNIIKRVKNFSGHVGNDPFENIEFTEMLEYSLSFCIDRLNYFSVKILKDSIPKGLKMHCCSERISQVIINLVNNAIDASMDENDRWIRISAQDLGEMIEIKITDCGQGIEPKHLEKLFIPFFTTKAKGQGTGLGLSISKSIVESHRGKLYYSNTDGNTSFVIEIPK